MCLYLCFARLDVFVRGGLINYFFVFGYKVACFSESQNVYLFLSFCHVFRFNILSIYGELLLFPLFFSPVQFLEIFVRFILLEIDVSLDGFDLCSFVLSNFAFGISVLGFVRDFFVSISPILWHIYRQLCICSLSDVGIVI